MSIEFWFLFSPNNSGTTVMCQALAAQGGGYLPAFGHHEGQMVPRVRRIMRQDPWNPQSDFDWTFIRTEWEALASAAGKEIFVEGSPPNMMRVGSIRRAFDGRMRAAFSISSPYLQIASCLKNYHSGEITIEAISDYAGQWLDKARRQFENVAAFPDIPLIRYEDFCRDPAQLSRAFGMEHRPVDGEIGKRTTGVDRIIDLTAKSLAFLTVFEVEILSRILEREAPLLEFFGYAPLSAGDYNRLLGENIGLGHAGLLDRFRWEQSGGRREKAGRRRRRVAPEETG